MPKVNLKRAAESQKEYFSKAAQAVAESSVGKIDQERLFQLRQALGRTVTLSMEEITIEDNIRSMVERDSEFEALVLDVAEKGIRRSLDVELKATPDGYKLICVTGQRRLLAAREAKSRELLQAKQEKRLPILDKLLKVPVLLLEYKNDKERTWDGLAENLLRKDLPPVDIARGYLRLFENGVSDQEIANRFGRDVRTVRRYLKVGRYPEDVLSQMSQRHDLFTARVILNHFGAKQFKTIDELRWELSRFLTEHSEETESATSLTHSADPHSRNKPGRKRKTEFAHQTEARIRQALSLKVRIIGDNAKGQVIFSYQSEDELGRLLELFPSIQSEV
jgi:ParB-like chromosome segregation protein Spo0J